MTIDDRIREGITMISNQLPPVDILDARRVVTSHGRPWWQRPAGLAAAAALVVAVAVSGVLATTGKDDAQPTPATPPTEPGTTGAITRVGDDFLELAGDDIFGDVAAGGGSVWMTTEEGLIQVDPTTMEATWHTGLAPGRSIVYAFDSLWLSVTSGVVRVDPTSLEEIARIFIAEPAGLAADEDSIWTTQRQSRDVFRIDPRTNEVTESIDVDNPDAPWSYPMGPSVVDGDVWVAMGNGSEVVRIDDTGTVTRIDLEREVLTPPVATPEAVWFSNPLYLDRKVTRIDRATGAVSSAELPASMLDTRPGEIGPGIYVADTLWFPTTGGTMVAIDPVTFDVLGTVPLQGSVPRKAVEYDGSVWVASEFNGSLERIPVERLVQGLAAAG